VFIYSLCNDVVSSPSESKASDVWMLVNNDLVRIWSNLGYCSAICLDGLRKTIKSAGQFAFLPRYERYLPNTRSYNKVRELIAVKVLHNSLLNNTLVTFKVLPLGSHAPMPAPRPPFKTFLELVLWNGLQSCCCITPDVINVIKIPSFQYFLYLREPKEVIGS